MTFLDNFREEQAAAGDIVVQRDQEGRNAAVSVKDQFESTDFVLGLIRMKVARAKSYLAASNFKKFREEMQDVANYSIFTIVFEKPEGLPGSWPVLDENGKSKGAKVFDEVAKR